MQLADELDELVRNARAVPLTDQVRIDREALYDLADRLRTLAAARLESGPVPEPVLREWREIVALIDRLDDLARDARSRRGKLRLDTTEASSILDRMLGHIAALDLERAADPDPRAFRDLVETARRLLRESEKERGVDGESLWAAIDGMREHLGPVAWALGDLDADRR